MTDSSKRGPPKRANLKLREEMQIRANSELRSEGDGPPSTGLRVCDSRPGVFRCKSACVAISRRMLPTTCTEVHAVGTQDRTTQGVPTQRGNYAKRRRPASEGTMLQ